MNAPCSSVSRRDVIGGVGGTLAMSALPQGQACAAAKIPVDEELAWIPAWQLRRLFDRRKLSPLEYAQFLLNRIERHRDLGAFITVDGDYLIGQARIASEQARGEAQFLHGLPVSVKDLVCTKGLRTTFGSRIFADYVPDVDAVAVEKLRQAGGIVFAKTNTPEFGQYFRTMNLVAAEALNPWDKSRTTGGSSGGAAAATAAGLGPLAVGTDGGGSVRLPSAFNGIFGLKASRGRIPNGAGPFANPNSALGPMTRDVRDAAMLLQVMACVDARDPFSMHSAPPNYLVDLEKGVRGVRLAWSADFGRIAPDEPEVVALCHEAARAFRALGAVYSEPAIRLEDPMDFAEMGAEFPAATVEKAMRALAPNYVDFGGWLSRQPQEKRALLSDPVANMGKYVDIGKYMKSIPPAVHARKIDQLKDLFQRFDLLLSPTISRRAFTRVGEEPTQFQYIAYTNLFNVAGYCAASVPAGFYLGMPVGLQIVGRPGDEALVLRAARAFERYKPWADHRPQI